MEEHVTGLPHVRGGVSIIGYISAQMPGSSPRAWGCFCLYQTTARQPTVFPTCVGVFLVPVPTVRTFESLPHVRGGVSAKHRVVSHSCLSSPRAWGCFCEVEPGRACRSVFPTCVGVFLSVIVSVQIEG